MKNKINKIKCIFPRQKERTRIKKSCKVYRKGIGKRSENGNNVWHKFSQTNFDCIVQPKDISAFLCQIIIMLHMITAKKEMWTQNYCNLVEEEDRKNRRCQGCINYLKINIQISFVILHFSCVICFHTLRNVVIFHDGNGMWVNLSEYSSSF